MSTNRNTKGQFAHKTAPKKPVKKPTKAQRELNERERVAVRWVLDKINEQTSSIRKQGEKLDQIQRDIDLLKSGSIFMQEVEQHKAAAKEQGLEEGVYIRLRPCEVQSGHDRVQWAEGLIRQLPENHNGRNSWLLNYEGEKHKADRVTAKKMGLVPEEPKAEPWVPSVGEWVVFLDDTWHAEVHKGAIEVESGPDCDGHWKTMASREYGGGIYFPASSARPATSEEIRAEKLKKLVRGCRVDTPYGEGIYLGRDGSGEGHHPYWVSLDREDGLPGSPDCFNIDQLTPLT